MEKSKVDIVAELFDLLNLYYEERDMPNEGMDFFEKVEKCCRALDLDFGEFKQVFGLG